MPAEPALVALPALNAKFTVLAERVSVSDSAKLAFKAIVCAPEFNCADANEAENVIAKPAIAAKMILPCFIFPPNVINRFLRCSRRPGRCATCNHGETCRHLVTLGDYGGAQCLSNNT